MSPNPNPVLQVEIDRQPDITVVRCTGKVILDTLSDFSVVRELIPEGKPVRVDLAKVTQVDSTGIGAFVSAWAAAKKHDVDLKFVNPNKAIEDLIEITRLQHIFEEQIA